MESGTCALLRLHFDLSAVRPDNDPGNAQAQTMASGCAASGLIRPVKPIKNALQLFFCYAYAGIRYRYSTEGLFFPA